MSISVDYFFNHSTDLPALTEEINRRVGCALSPYEGNPEDLFCRFFAMELSLAKNELENDGELNFEELAYQVGIRTPVPDADLRGMQLPLMALLAYALYRRLGIVGMLVYDTQALLARYEERVESEANGARMFDIISGEFVEFPTHLETLRTGGLIPTGRVERPVRLLLRFSKYEARKGLERNLRWSRRRISHRQMMRDAVSLKLRCSA